MRKAAVLILSLLILSGPVFAEAQPENNVVVEEALESSSRWLKLIDGGMYAVSWEQASEYFKKAVGKNEWDQTLEALREPLGGVISRKLKFFSETASLPGAPDGRYIVIQYDTRFENKSSAFETISLILEDDRGWRICGYYIR